MGVYSSNLAVVEEVTHQGRDHVTREVLYSDSRTTGVDRTNTSLHDGICVGGDDMLFYFPGRFNIQLRANWLEFSART